MKRVAFSLVKKFLGKINLRANFLKRKRIPGKFKLNINFLKNKSIFGKLIISFLSVIVITLAVINYISSIIINDSSKRQFIASTSQLLEQNKNYVDVIVKNIDNYTLQLVSDTKFLELSSVENSDDSDIYTKTKEIQSTLNNIISTNQYIESAYVINPSGISTGAPRFGGYNLTESQFKEKDLYKTAQNLKGQNFWIPPHKDEFGTNKEQLVISDVRLIKYRGTDKSGVLTFNINPQVFQDKLKNIKIGNNGYMYIIDKDGNVISHKDAKLLGMNWSSDENIKKILSSANGNFTFKDPDINKEMFAVYTTSEETGWKYAAVVPYSELTNSSKKVSGTVAVVSLLCLAFTSVIAFIISKSISSPIKDITKVMAEVEAGNLNVSMKVKNKDELQLLANGFNRMIENLREIVSEVKLNIKEANASSMSISSAIEELTKSSVQIFEATGQIASGSSIQAEKSSECVETAEEFGEKLSLVLEHTKEVSISSQEAKDKSSEGMKFIHELDNKSSSNLAMIKNVYESINELSQNTKEINNILGNISEISEQTNLLSLNAAIEAARAGEAGRGFAVVADEVKKLAEKSKSFTEQISGIIRNINSRTLNSVTMSQKVIKEIEGQNSYVHETLNAFNDIKTKVDNVEYRITNLSDALLTLEKGKKDLIELIQSISCISQESSALTEEVSASIQNENEFMQDINKIVEDLISNSDNLTCVISKFNTK